MNCASARTTSKPPSRRSFTPPPDGFARPFQHQCRPDPAKMRQRPPDSSIRPRTEYLSLVVFAATKECSTHRRSVLEQSLQSDPQDERGSGQSGYLTLPGDHGRMILHGLRGEGGSVEPEISPLTIPVATRSRMEAFRLPFPRRGKAGRP